MELRCCESGLGCFRGPFAGYGLNDRKINSFCNLTPANLKFSQNCHEYFGQIIKVVFSQYLKARKCKIVNQKRIITGSGQKGHYPHNWL